MLGLMNSASLYQIKKNLPIIIWLKWNYNNNNNNNVIVFLAKFRIHKHNGWQRVIDTKCKGEYEHKIIIIDMEYYLETYQEITHVSFDSSLIDEKWNFSCWKAITKSIFKFFSQIKLCNIVGIQQGARRWICKVNELLIQVKSKN